MGVPTHCGGAEKGGTGIDWGIYCLPPEHVCPVHRHLSYHGFVFGGRAEAWNVHIQVMVEAAHPVYHRDKGGQAAVEGGEETGEEELEAEL